MYLVIKTKRQLFDSQNQSTGQKVEWRIPAPELEHYIPSNLVPGFRVQKTLQNWELGDSR